MCFLNELFVTKNDRSYYYNNVFIAKVNDDKPLVYFLYQEAVKKPAFFRKSALRNEKEWLSDKRRVDCFFGKIVVK